MMQPIYIPFCQEWLDALKDCSKSVKLKFYEAIVTYCLTGEEPPLSPMLRLVFNLVRDTLDRERLGKAPQHTREQKASDSKDASVQKSEDNSALVDVYTQQAEEYSTPVTLSAQEASYTPATVDTCTQELTAYTPATVEVGAQELTTYNSTTPVEVRTSSSEKRPSTPRKKTGREREDKESKQEKEKCPPHPLTKEKEIKKEKEGKENKLLLGERKEKFREEIFRFAAYYPTDMLNRFFDYWSEPNHAGRKMRCELEKTWNTASRLRLWASRDHSFAATRYTSATPSTREQRDREAAEIIQRFMAESAAGTAYPDAPF